MGFFTHRHRGNKPVRRSKKEIMQLKEKVEKGSHYEAAQAATELISIGDYSCMDLMISRLFDHRMAEPLSGIPNEAVIMPLILSISKYAILNLNVSAGSEKFDARSTTYILNNLVRNFHDQVYAYIAEMSHHHFFFMKDRELYYTVGKHSFGSHLDRPDLIAGCARDALAKVPQERIQEALDQGKAHYQYAGGQFSDQEIRNILFDWKP